MRESSGGWNRPVSIFSVKRDQLTYSLFLLCRPNVFFTIVTVFLKMKKSALHQNALDQEEKFYGLPCWRFPKFVITLLLWFLLSLFLFWQKRCYHLVEREKPLEQVLNSTVINLDSWVLLTGFRMDMLPTNLASLR